MNNNPGHEAVEGAAQAAPSSIRIRALGILEPPGFDRRVMPGETVTVDATYGARVCNGRLAEPVARKPSVRAEKRPKAPTEQR